MSEERKAQRSILESGRAIVQDQQHRGPVLEDDQRAAVVFAKDDDGTRVAGAVSVGANAEVSGGAEKSKRRGWGIFGGFSWRKPKD